MPSAWRVYGEEHQARRLQRRGSVQGQCLILHLGTLTYPEQWRAIEETIARQGHAHGQSSSGSKMVGILRSQRGQQTKEGGCGHVSVGAVDLCVLLWDCKRLFLAGGGIYLP